MAEYSIKVKDYCIYYLQVEGKDYDEVKAIAMDRITDGDYDNMEAGELHILEVRKGELKETFGVECAI